MTALLRGLHVAASLSLFGCLVFRTVVLRQPTGPGGSPMAALNRIGSVSAQLALPADPGGLPPTAVNRIGSVSARLALPAGAGAWPMTAVNRIGSVSAWLALVLGAGWLVAVSGTMAGAGDIPSLFNAVLTVARHTSFGNVLCVRLLLLAGALALLAVRRERALVAALVASGAAVALQPMLGHIGASEVPVLIPVEMVHLLAAGAWLGGLPPLLLYVVRAPTPLAVKLCERFTPVGLVAVGTIAITALPQAGELIGGLPGLFGTQYGHLALTKLGLFAAALGLACLNRLVLTTRLGGTGRAARRWLIGSIAIETAVVSCVVLAAATMASSVPAAHTQPVWPFTWRPSLDAWEEPELRGELIWLFVAAAAGVAIIVVSQLLRRFRIVALVLAAIVVAPFIPSLGLLLVEAYPTSYMRSPTGFSVDAIAHGQTLFGQRCATCHDPQIGTGSGADLTAPHLWGHLDGELFWWVTNGVIDPEGAALMPGFGSVLSEDDRWALIDFVRARNVGLQAAGTGQWSPPVAAPATPLNCAGNDFDALTDLSARVLIVVIEGDPAGVSPGGAHPAGISDASVAGATTIRIAHGAEEQPRPGECVAVAPTAWEAWRVLAGVPAERFAGYRAIVDGQGWLRTWLPPDVGPARVLAEVRNVGDHPIAGARPGSGHHH